MTSKRILIWDIESSNLSANFGFIICISYKWLGEGKVNTLCITDFPEFKLDPTNDKRVVSEFGKVYGQADMTVAHYGQKFDLPMVNTRRLIHRMSPLPPMKLYDTWRTSKDKLKLNSNRLATLISALGIKYKKTELNGPIWVKAMAGDKKAIAYVKKHCEMDVLALEQAYLKLCPLTTENQNPLFHQCGDKYMKSEGLRVCDKKTYRRLYCKKCGGFFKGPVESK